MSPLYLCFRAKQEINPLYFEWYFRSSAWHRYIYMSGDSGARHDRVSIKDDTFFAMPINIPSAKEQDRIALFLNAIEQRIDKQRSLVEALKKYKRGVTAKLIAAIEEKYPVVRLGDHVTVMRGGSPRPIDAYITNAENGIRWIKIGDALPDQLYISDTKEKIKPEGAKKSRRVYAGDLILSNSMSFGRPYILKVDGCIHDGWLLIRDEEKKFDKRFLCFYLASDVTLAQYMLKEVQKQIDEDAHLIIQKTGSQWFTAETKNVIGNRPVYSFSITGANGKQLTNFGKGRVSVSLPYTHNAYENPAGLMAYYINKAGVAFPVPNSAYEAKSGTVSFVTDHFSYFAVGFRAPIAFSDITNHWAKSSIDYATVRGLLSGTGYGKFSPDAAITRGMLVTALGRLAEVNVSAYKTSSFTDVKAGAYYLPYVEWANKNGIMTGIGGGKFAPDQKVTREQMAVVVQNYAKAIGFELPKIRMENTFADVNEIGAFAKGAVKAVQMAGVLTGKDGNRFEPKGTVTRAEASVILERFARTRISTTSYVEGWVRNDSGKWMYYVSGKPVTGSRIIDGKSYVFDQNGVTAQKR